MFILSANLYSSKHETYLAILMIEIIILAMKFTYKLANNWRNYCTISADDNSQFWGVQEKMVHFKTSLEGKCVPVILRKIILILILITIFHGIYLNIGCISKPP
jgi:hypothetical protein